MKVVVRNFGDNTSFLGAKGSEGLSAYEVAKKNGFVGTETEWVAKSSPYRIVDTIVQMYDLPHSERVVGMVVNVIESGYLYELKGGIENVNFVISYAKFESVESFEDISESATMRFIRVKNDSNAGDKGWYVADGNEIEELFTL